MTTEQLKREMNYRASMAMVKSMLNKGLVTKQEYRVIDTKLTKKYEPVLGSLCS